MENENLNNQGANNEPRKKVKKALAITGLAIFILVAGYFGTQYQDLLRAELTSGNSSASTQLYIRDDYTGEPGETDTIVVRNGIALDNLVDLDLRLSAVSSQLTFVDVDLGSGPLAGTTFTTTNNGDGTFDINFSDFGAIVSLPINQKLFEVRVILDSGLVNNDTVLITYVDANSTIQIQGGSDDPIASFTDGKVTISSTSACELLSCGDYGACNPSTELCECNRGYFGLECGECDLGNGYTGVFPDCTYSAFSALEGMILTLSDQTVSQLLTNDTTEYLNAYSSVYLMVNSLEEAGQTITIGEATTGGTVIIPTIAGPVITACNALGGDLIDPCKFYALLTDPDGVQGNGDGLIDLLEAATDGTDQLLTATTVSTVPGTIMSGVIKLTPTTADVNGALEDITSSTGAIEIIPAVTQGVTLDPNDAYSYILKVIGKFDDGSAQNLNFSEVTWLPQPMNRLNNDALNGGLLEPGDVPGSTPLFVQMEIPGATIVPSNVINVTVPAGPTIEYIRRIGTENIVKGGQIDLSVKVTDQNSIQDISSISTSIVRSTATTYNGINSDSSAIFFNIIPFSEPEIVVINAAAEGGEEEAPPVEEETQSQTQSYRIYDIPVSIPQDANLTDGSYKLLLEITDASGFTSASVMPIEVGAAASGDISSDGNLSMLDVVLLFKFANGIDSPTIAEAIASDMNGDGNITILDVVLLYNQVNQ